MRPYWWMGLLMACTGPGTAPDDTDPPVDVPTWSEDVEPIYAQHCLRCHGGEGTAAFSMRDHDEARSWARAAQKAVHDRRMPPWTVGNDGDCGTWSDPNEIDAEELAILDAWWDNGTPAGPDLPPTEVAALPTLDGTEVLELTRTVDLSIVLDAPDRYWCIPYEVPDDFGFATGFEVVPSHPELLHHTTLDIFEPSQVLPDGRTIGEVVAELDAASAVPGFPCQAPELDGRGPSEMLFSWAAGSGAVRFPAGTGLRVAPDALFVVQHHLAGPPSNVLDETQVRLAHVSEVDHPAQMWLVPGFQFLDMTTPGGMTLPPGEEAYELVFDSTLADLNAELSPLPDTFEVYGVMAHMHGMGRAQETFLGDVDDPACFSRISPYDDDWQRMYWRADPVRATLDDRLRFSCTFDTRSAEGPVYTSFSATDEMCMVQLYIVEE